MKIVLIGSGNLATHLAIALNASGNEIAQIFSRTLENAKSLAEKTGARYTDDVEQIDCNADLYIFSVKDDTLPEILKRMPKTKGIWVHTAGSVPINVFVPYTDNYGIIYPLQTFSKNKTVNFADILVFIEGSNTETIHSLETLAKSISKNISYLSSEKRQYLHLAAVFVCNFTNHLYTLSAEILEKEDIPFDVLKPLIMETATKVMELSPKAAQTGPAVRFDETVMSKHIDLLTDGDMKYIYKILSESIYKHMLAIVD
ncbi:MAG: DUF2520 domain-containing protein [Dysgonamonadaceae bacterium]|jgi:predicted short-subunit dehydrogenase-like oxidoreductase (DUF2520 family)|nr:DUF2520 domain-containing protein [Dysgonamonadaceae bacterium]